MIVPKYWAEAKSRISINGSQATFKRFGWSDISESDAKTNANKRLKEAIALAESGEKVRKIDHKVAYNGAEGLPIREEIISRHKDSVITRNSYGALCLNTPDVLFADIDLVYEASFKLCMMVFLVLMCAAIFTALHFDSWAVFIALFVVSAIFTTTIASVLFKLINALMGGTKEIAMRAIREFSKNNPDWHLRIYRTPGGYRILVMHKTFNPKDEETLNFLKAVESDPLYIQMCKNQNCFRARVSPKPWRIGVQRMGPRPGVWPIKPERMPARVNWVNNYDRVSSGYASCEFIEQLGSKISDSKAEYIRALHDDYCKSDSGLKLA